MPVYEFTCENCQKDFELLCPMDTEVKDVKCPTCNQNHLTRKVSLFGYISGGSDTDSCMDGSCQTDFESSGGCGGCGPSGCGCG
jgi:putative FmdB family regulatory protein